MLHLKAPESACLDRLDFAALCLKQLDSPEMHMLMHQADKTAAPKRHNHMGLVCACSWTNLCGWNVVVWTGASAIILSLPLTVPLSATTFNYAAGGLAFVILGSFASWHLSAQHWFQGPQPSISSSDAVRVKEFGWK